MSGVRLLGRGAVHRLLDANGIVPSRARGQNFVADPNTVGRVARLAQVGPGDRVIEIGAGLGSLTLALAATGATVVAVEIDAALAAVLRRVVPPDVEIVEADALALDFGAVLGDAGSATLVANLPYNVATPLVMTLLERVPAITRMVVMVQREVAERLAAEPGTRTFAGITARRSYFASARIVGHVSPEVFVPKPHVMSAIVEITRFARPAVDPSVATYDEIATLVRAGFSSRRKMLRGALRGIVDEAGFAAAGIAPTARAESIDIAAWGKLAAWKRSERSAPTRS